MGFAAFLIAVLLGTGLAYGTGRNPVMGGLYCGIGFAVTMFVVQALAQNLQTAFLLAVPVGLGVSFLAPKAEEKR